MASWFETNGFLAGDSGPALTYPSVPLDPASSLGPYLPSTIDPTTGYPLGPDGLPNSEGSGGISGSGFGPGMFGPGGSVAPPALPGNPTNPWATSGLGGVIRQPTGTGPGGSPFPPATTNTNPTLPGTISPNGGSSTPIFPGVGGSGNAVPFPTGPATPTTPTTPATGPSTTTGSGSTNSAQQPGESVRDWVIRTATANGRPDIAGNPDYWVGVIQQQGPNIDAGYWTDRMRTANQGGSGGSAGGYGAGGSLGSMGAFLQPYNQTFTAPTGTDDPGFQFALQQGTDAIQRSAAAKGNLLTGGVLKDLASYTTGAALQDYAGAYNRAANTFGINRDIFYHNQDSPFSKLYNVTGLGLNATENANSAAGAYGNNLASLGSGYGGNLTSLANGYGGTTQNNTTTAGNINAAGTIGQANNTNNGISAALQWFQQYHPYGASY